MASILLSDNIKDLIDDISSQYGSNVDDTDNINLLLAARTRGSFTTKDVKILQTYMKKTGKSITLKELLQDSVLTFPSIQPKSTEPSPELIKRREYLRGRQETRLYNQMIYGKFTTPYEDELVRLDTQFSTTTNQAAIGGNMIAAIIATFGIGYCVSLQLQYDKNIVSQY
jgi:hypothetical protein